MHSVQCTDAHIGVRKGELLVSKLTEELLQFRPFFLLVLSTMGHDTATEAILSNTRGGLIHCKMKMTNLQFQNENRKFHCSIVSFCFPV